MSSNDISSSYHHIQDTGFAPRRLTPEGELQELGVGVFDNHIEDLDLSFDFSVHYHPYTTELLQRLIDESIEGLLEGDTEPGPPRSETFTGDRSIDAADYDPNFELFGGVVRSFPNERLDFEVGGAYSLYNWEIFYHIPMTIATHLSNNQRYEEAMRWFHLIFDPTDDSDGSTPERFWKVKPFQKTDVKLIEDILHNLASGADAETRENTLAAIDALEDSPFRPHVVARYRQSAYMMRTVMAYLDNLIAWGDSLFRQDTIESINEATQLYVMASNILGPRPQEVPENRSPADAKTYADIRQEFRGRDPRSDLENDLPMNQLSDPGPVGDEAKFSLVASVGRSLYFCVPPNDEFLGYWDTVADRLFKIHNSLNLQGVFRQLPLYEPPIDPEALAKARAAGVDVSAAVRSANQPLPKTRYKVLFRKAEEICNEVKSLGGKLQAALEKEDSERLEALRAQHQHSILEMVESVRYAQVEQAKKTREGVRESLEKAFNRYRYYERLLGKAEGDIEQPEMPDLDPSAIDDMDVDLSEPELDLRDIEINVVDSREAQSSVVSSGHPLIQSEVEELRRMELVRRARNTASVLKKAAGVAAVIPQAQVNLSPMGTGSGTEFGGDQISQGLSYGAEVSRFIAQTKSGSVRQLSKMSGFSRREIRWASQSQDAAQQVNQLFKRLRAAELREEIAKRELENHRQRIKNAEEIEQFLTESKKGQTTNQDFYAWMKRQVRGIYNQCYELALDVAQKAERGLQHELGDQELDFIDTDYQAGREGLLAGEKLSLDLQRMDVAYHEQRQREYELETHVSLKEIAPAKLVNLRKTGSCTFELPEELFDMDIAGHYFRRIKSVSVSIPSVTGPYTSVNCTLRLLNSRVRTTPDLSGSDGESYRWNGPEDDRFSHRYGVSESIVTSTAQDDDGLFRSSTNDDRYLPFEGHGVASKWRLELPELEQFDHDSIEDVVIHIEYTAREGGKRLRNAANSNLDDILISGSVQESDGNDENIEYDTSAYDLGSRQLISVRHDFPDAWSEYKNSDSQGELYQLNIPLSEFPYPHWLEEAISGATVSEVEFIGDVSSDETEVKITDPDSEGSVTLPKPKKADPNFPSAKGSSLVPDTPVDASWSLNVDSQDLRDLWVLLDIEKLDISGLEE